MAIVRGAFSKLLQPGLIASLNAVDKGLWRLQKIEQEDEMAILHPNTSGIPVWRRRATRSEHPISAWRAWALENITDPEQRKYEGCGAGWHLVSVAASCIWSGPVLRAHKRPVDPAYWDAKRSAKNTEAGLDQYYEEMRDTFECAGIWAVKTEADSRIVAEEYSAACYGRVTLWGRVAQFARGYRGELCMVKELRVRPLHRLLTDREVYAVGSDRQRYREVVYAKAAQIAKGLSRRYGCEVSVCAI